MAIGCAFSRMMKPTVAIRLHAMLCSKKWMAYALGTDDFLYTRTGSRDATWNKFANLKTFDGTGYKSIAIDNGYLYAVTSANKVYSQELRHATGHTWHEHLRTGGTCSVAVLNGAIYGICPTKGGSKVYKLNDVGGAGVSRNFSTAKNKAWTCVAGGDSVSICSDGTKLYSIGKRGNVYAVPLGKGEVWEFLFEAPFKMEAIAIVEGAAIGLLHGALYYRDATERRWRPCMTYSPPCEVIAIAVGPTVDIVAPIYIPINPKNKRIQRRGAPSQHSATPYPDWVTKIAIKSFDPSAYGPDYLALKTGDAIRVRPHLESGWAKGYSVRLREVGWFPPTFCTSPCL